MSAALKFRKVEAGDVKIMMTKNLKLASWYPKNRISEANIKGLVNSVEDVGMQVPILVNAEGVIIDGGRRFAAAKQLGYQHIRVISTDCEYNHLFGSLQGSSKKLSGNDLLGVYLGDPYVLTTTQRDKIKKIEETCGYSAVKMLYEGGYTQGAFGVALRINRYTQGRVSIKNGLTWIVKQGMSRCVGVFMDNVIPVNTIVEAVESAAPINLEIVTKSSFRIKS